MNLPTKQLNYIRSLDGLRAIAILLVIFYHCTPNTNANLGIVSIPFKLANFGWSGVDLFFILSGFLVTRILLFYQTNGISYKAFFINRLLRIVPAYYTALIVIFFIMPIITGWDFLNLVTILRHVLYVVNLWPGEPIYERTLLTGHFWTLGVEMQFYLFLPILFLFVKDNIHKYIICLWLVFIVCRAVATFTGNFPVANFLLHSFRIDGLLLGAIVALAPNLLLKYKVVFYSVLIVVLTYLASVTWYSKVSSIFKVSEFYTIHQILIPTMINIFYVQLLVLVLNTNNFGVLLDNGVFRVISKYSYGMYIYHYIFYPIFLTGIYPSIADIFGYGNLSAFVFCLVVCCFALVCAFMSFHLLEKHFLRLKQRI